MLGMKTDNGTNGRTLEELSVLVLNAISGLIGLSFVSVGKRRFFTRNAIRIRVIRDGLAFARKTAPFSRQTRWVTVKWMTTSAGVLESISKKS